MSISQVFVGALLIVACITDLRTRRIPNALTFSAAATALAARFVAEDRGQDLIEYALLTAIIGISGVLTFSTLRTTMGTAYSSWNTAGQDAWQPCPPQPAACP